MRMELKKLRSYYGARINVEMFHAISDGNGGMVFLKTLVHNYLPVSYTHLAQRPQTGRGDR